MALFYWVVALLKKASLMGAFFLLFSAPAYAASSFCPLQKTLPEYSVKHVVDGDTVRLQDGRSVRLIGINAPELGGSGRSTEPYAVKATRYLKSLIKENNGKVALRVGQHSHDRYGRVLASLYDANGASLAEQLVAKGLAYHVAIAPNLELTECLTQAEAAARQQQLGLWQTAHFTPAQTLQQGGFTLLQGRIQKVQRNRGGVWLELGHSVTVNIPIEAMEYFRAEHFANWQGRHLQARGWIAERSAQNTQYARWRLTVSHPSMLRVQ